MKALYPVTLCLYIATSIAPHYLLSSDPYSKNQDTPIQQLWLACAQGQVKQIRTFLGENIDYKKIDADGNTIVHILAKTINTSHKLSAIVTEQTELLAALLKYFPKQKNYSVLRQRNSKGDTPMHILMTGSSPYQETIALCIQYDPKCVHVKNSGGKFPDQCVSSTQEKLFNIRCAITDPKETEK